jgi:hypothetical protein
MVTEVDKGDAAVGARVQPRNHGASADRRYSEVAQPAEPQAKEFYDMLYELRVSYTKEVEARLGRLDKLVGGAHYLSVGNYKEQVIRDQLESITPRKYSVNTGFVVANERGSIIRSKQIDVLIWDSTNFSPILKAGDFVVIQPEALRAAVEVKGVLDHDEFDNALENLESLTRFSNAMMAIHPLRPRPRFPFVRFLVAGSIGKSDKGPLFQFPATVWNKLYAKYPEQVIKDRLSWVSTWTDLASMAWINGIAVMSHGYVGTSATTEKPGFVSHALLSEVQNGRGGNSQPDESMGILRTHLEVALTYPTYYSHLSQAMDRSRRQLVLPYNGETVSKIDNPYKPRKPYTRKLPRSFSKSKNEVP